MIIYSIHPTSRPLEPSRRPGGRSEEDEFMELHGGRGARLIYRIVCLVGALSDTAFSVVGGNRRAIGVTEVQHTDTGTKDAEKTTPCRPACAATPLKTHPQDAPAISTG